MLNGIDKYIQCITVCFLYSDITDLNNNEIDDFQELFLNLLLDIKDGLCNYCRSNCRTNMSTVRRGCIIEGKAAPQGLGLRGGQTQKYINDLKRLIRQ